MTTVTRYDYSDFKATKTDEGFLVDTPVVARIGIQEYRRADGTIRREFRPPEEVFHADSLASYRGKPITVDHPVSGRVTAKSAHRDVIGTMLTEGRQDGEQVRTDVTIHSPDSIGERRELSVGYTTVLDETPGEWNGQRYDAIQRTIRVNHLSVVKKGRAGVARLNLDSEEVTDAADDANNFPTQQEQQTMTEKVKLDNGLEYDAAPEVRREFDKLRADASDVRTKLDTVTAERDTLQAKVDGLDDQLKTAREQGRVDALQRLELEGTAAKFKVDHADKTDRQIKEAVILAVTPTAKLDDKSDAYIAARFDAALDIAPAKTMEGQRKAVHTHNDAAQPKTSHDAYKESMARLMNKEAAK